MTKFDHNQICTTDKTIAVGQQYQYYEDGIVADVLVLKDVSDDKSIGFELKVMKPLNGFFKINQKFSCSAARGHYAYSGMWRLYDLNTYMAIKSDG